MISETDSHVFDVQVDACEPADLNAIKTKMVNVGQALIYVIMLGALKRKQAALAKYFEKSESERKRSARVCYPDLCAAADLYFEAYAIDVSQESELGALDSGQSSGASNVPKTMRSIMEWAYEKELVIEDEYHLFLRLWSSTNR